MKYMSSISMLMLTTMVSMAARPDNSKCRPVTVSYSECVNNHMNLTKYTPEGVEGCTNTTVVVSCVTSFTRLDENCTQTITTNLTACGTPGSDVNTSMKTIAVNYTDCTIKPSVTRIPCNESGNMGDGHREGMHGDNLRGSWLRKEVNYGRYENERCKPYTLSYSECVDENQNIMNLTKTPHVGVEGCTNVTEEIPCVSTQASTWGGCTQNKTINNTACGTPGVDLNLLVKTITFSYSVCFSLESKTIQIPCNRFGGVEGFRRQPAGNGMSRMPESNNKNENGSGHTEGKRRQRGFGGNEGSTKPPAGNGMSRVPKSNNKKENGSGHTDSTTGHGGSGSNVGSTTPAGNGMSRMPVSNNKKENGSGHTDSTTGHSGSRGNVGSTKPPIVSSTTGVHGVKNRKEIGSRENYQKGHRSRL